jgi:hypothetical protein
MKENKLTIKKERLDFEFNHLRGNYTISRIREVGISTPDVITEEYSVSFKGVGHTYIITNPGIINFIIKQFKDELKKLEGN